MGKRGGEEGIEVSFVMPCLNEAETLEACIRKARRAIEAHGLPAEIVVADNGSTDGSQEIARRLGARVVPVAARGYGAALAGGIGAARGRYVIMGDADDSYDFSAVQPFIEKLRQGYDLVMGCRLPAGGGTILPGAMPFKHRYLGNPVLSFIGRLFFRSPVTDFHCGLRGFTREAFQRMELRTTGMEFASEMVLKATLLGMRITEVPITLHPDGRSRPPHLRSWRDGWRHLVFMLLYAPNWLFLGPAALLGLAGLAGVLLLLPGPLTVGSVTFDTNSLIVSSMLILLAAQLGTFYFFTKTFSITEGLLPETRVFRRLFSMIRLETGVLLGLLFLVAGAGLLLAAVRAWAEAGFGDLSYPFSLRRVVPAVLLIVLGAQTVFASFFMSVLGLRRR